jgi:hypothetical protein
MVDWISGMSGLNTGLPIDITGSVTTGMIIIALLAVAAAGIISFVLWRKGAWIFRKFRVPTIIFYTLASGAEISFTMSRFYKERNIDMMETKNGNYKGPKFSDKDLMFGDYAIMVVPELGEAHPVKIIMNKVQITDKDHKVTEKDLVEILPLIKHDSKMAFINEIEKNAATFKLEGWMAKYGHYVILVLVIVFSYLMLNSSSNALAASNAQSSQAMTTFADAINRFTYVMNKTGFIVPGGT